MITSVNNPRIKQLVLYRTKAKERRKEGVFVAEGFRMFEEAPADLIREIYLTKEALQRLCKEEGMRRKLEKAGYETVSEEVFGKISDTKTPQGVLTVVRQPEYQLEEILGVENPFLLILEDIQDPGNLGTMMRTGEGAGITGIIMSSNTADLFNPKTIRATMGSIYRVPYYITPDLPVLLGRLRTAGIHTYAAHIQSESLYDSFSFREPTAFLIGNEGAGLRKETADESDSYLKIPMEGQVESLNAAISAAVLMYEAHRQRVAMKYLKE